MLRFHVVRLIACLGAGCLIIAIGASCATEADGPLPGDLLPGDVAGSAPVVYPGFAETGMNTDVVVELAGDDPSGEALAFSVVEPPVNGTLGPVESTGTHTARVRYTPGPDAAGPDSFQFKASNSALSSLVETATIRVLTPVIFTVKPRDEAGSLSVTAVASTLDGSPLPAGTYEWTFGDQSESGPVDTHGRREYTFARPGLYMVTLSLTLAGGGSTISCLSDATGKPVQRVLVGRTISGHIFTCDGSGFEGVVVGADGGGTTSVTDRNGYYIVYVPNNWAGEVTPVQAGHSFVPPARSYRAVTSRVARQDFRDEGPNCNRPPQVAEALSDVTVNEDAEHTMIDLASVFVDPDAGDTLSYSATVNDNSDLVNVAFSGTLMTLSYVADAHGHASITVRAEDAQGLGVENDIRVTVNPVNDKPGCSSPGDQSAAAGTGLSVQMSVSPGPDNESDQTVTLVASSSNQAILPDANIVASGNQLTITPVAGGTVTVSVQAHDNGGTEFGGIDTGEPTTFDVTVEGDDPVVLDWEAPIGIPTPSFGIVQSHEMYAGSRFDFDGDGQLEAGEEYRNAGNGPYTHYIDNTHAAARDNNNPYGTHSQPRMTIPMSIPAGSVVEIHGSSYTLGNNPTITGNGTSSKPVFLRGAGGLPNIKHATTVKSLAGSYFIVEDLKFDRVRVPGGSHHVAIRGCDIYGYNNRNCVELAGTDLVVFDNYIHNAGDGVPLSDDHGITAGAGAQKLWIVDNEITGNTGDGIQFCHHCPESSAPRYVYIGRNDIHHNTENGVDFKTSRDVVVSQNRLYGHAASDGSDGTAFLIGSNGLEDAAVNIWGIFNEIYNNDGAMRIESSANPNGTAGPAYLVGNKVYNIAKSALRLEKDGNAVWFVGNTVYDADTGINQDWQPNFVLEIHNNIFANLRGQQFGNHINVQTSGVANSSGMSHNLFWQGGSPVKIKWGGSTVTYSSSQQLQNFPGGSSNKLSNPLFVNPGNGDLHIASQSPARNAADSSIYEQLAEKFEQTFGEDIRMDFDGLARMQESACDMGAFEWPEN